MLTCCPACRTCFRITDAQLAVAQGKVRCGKCKTVFNGRQHMQTSTSGKQSPPAAKPTTTTPPPPPPKQQPAADKKPDLDNLDLFPAGETAETDSDLEPTLDNIEAPQLPEEESVVESDGAASRYKFDDFTDEVEEQQDLDDILAEMNQQLSQGIDTPAPEPPEPLDLPQSASTTPATESKRESDELGAAIDHLLDEIQTEAQPDELNIDEEFQSPDELEMPSESDSEDTERPGEAPYSDEAQQATDDTAAPADEKKERVPLRLRDSLNVAPPQPRSWQATLGAVVLILLLLGALAFQLVLFRPIDVVQLLPRSQPYIKTFCQQLPCQFHHRQDLDQLQLLSRDVRADPKHKNALLITATMVNKADFKQPYPGLRVSLFDLSGNVVARRRFTPEEYMGELASPFLLMTPRTPVQITLEVKDPGNDAINFAFDFE
jgi:predicted Zn finger-like uncharacterized protein